MITTLKETKIWLGIDVTDNSDDDVINAILAPADKWIKEYCQRDFELTSYTSELYDGQGHQNLFLKHYPVIEVTGLEIDGEAIDLDDLITYENGTLYYAAGFPGGHQNISVTYSAGYATLPEDLKLATNMLVKMIYDRRDQEVFGVEQYSLGYVRSVLTEEMPHEVREILSRYTKIEV